MNSIDNVAAWACLGLAAAIVACIWPFRRGVPGIIVNVFVAVAGAIAGGFGFAATGLARASHDPIGLLAAVVGAALFLVMTHFIWNRIDPRPGAAVKAPEDVTEGLAPSQRRESPFHHRRPT